MNPDPVADFLAECERIATVCGGIDFEPDDGCMGDEYFEPYSSKEQEAQQNDIRVAATALPKLVAMVRHGLSWTNMPDYHDNILRILKDVRRETQTSNS